MAFMDILSAEFIRYNANAAGHSTGDCVKRALSLAFDVPYNTMSKELIAEMKSKRADKWNMPRIYEPVITRHGGGTKITVEDRMLLSEFADTTGKNGTWLVTTGKKPGDPNHIVCIIDGTIYDSWDSTSECVCSYTPVEAVIERHFTEINISDYIEEIRQTFIDTTRTLCSKYPWNEFIASSKFECKSLRDNKYKEHLYCDIVMGDRPYSSSHTRYSFDFYVVFTPSTTEEEAHKIIKNTIKTRVYDRLYSINQQEKKKEEGAQYGGIRRPEWLTPREARFWNTLSAKAQSIVRYINIQDPDQYSDSYQVKVAPLWGEDGSVWLDAYTAGELRELIDAYIADGTTSLDY